LRIYKHLKIVFEGGSSGCAAMAQFFKCAVEEEPGIVAKIVNDAVTDVSVKV